MIIYVYRYRYRYIYIYICTYQKSSNSFHHPPPVRCCFAHPVGGSKEIGDLNSSPAGPKIAMREERKEPKDQKILLLFCSLDT